MARSRVTVKDHGLKSLMKRLQGAPKVRLTVGVHEDDGAATYPDGTSIAEVATYNELGLGVPRRSFIADWEDENHEQHQADIRKSAEAVVAGSVKSPEQAMDRLGLRFVGEVQKRIKDGIDPPDAPETVKAKGSSTPLIDHGLLWTSIRHKVESK
jgi:hypothetical protein